MPTMRFRLAYRALANALLTRRYCRTRATYTLPLTPQAAALSRAQFYLQVYCRRPQGYDASLFIAGRSGFDISRSSVMYRRASFYFAHAAVMADDFNGQLRFHATSS